MKLIIFFKLKKKHKKLERMNSIKHIHLISSATFSHFSNLPLGIVMPQLVFLSWLLSGPSLLISMQRTISQHLLELAGEQLPVKQASELHLDICS